MDPTTADRLERIESTLAHLEHLYEQLNEIVVAHGKQIDRLQTRQRQVSETVTSIEMERIRATSAKPPHY